MDMTIFIPELILIVVDGAVALLGGLGTVFSGVVELVYVEPEFTELGGILILTAGFALAYAGIRFIFGLVARLTGSTRGGAR